MFTFNRFYNHVDTLEGNESKTLGSLHSTSLKLI